MARQDTQRETPGGRGGSFRGGTVQFASVCGKCGATRQDRQIGLEPSVDTYVAELVAVFREVRRVLRDDGTLWLNLGDSYAANRTYQVVDNKHRDVGNNGAMRVPDGLKPKDLIGIPWRVAFALQADGWWLRQDIIWAKPNPMPESVTDRCTKSHEYIFLLSKRLRYFYDAAAIAEPSLREGDVQTFGSAKGRAYAPEPDDPNYRNGSDQWGRTIETGAVRNKRSVWTVATQPLSAAHFAVFPASLIEPCIKAGSGEGDTVLDPFAGAGTTGLVADRLGRDAILIELNTAYVEIAKRRIAGDAPLFAQIAAD